MKHKNSISHFLSKHMGRITQVQAVVTVLLFFPLFSSASDSLKIAISEYPPFIEESAQKKGLISEIVTKAFLLANIESELLFSTWAEAEELVDNNNRISFMWAKTPERDRKWLYSSTIYTGEYVFLSRTSSRFKYNRLDELRPYRIGTTRSYNYGQTFEEYKEHLKVEESISDYVSIKNLVKGYYDAVLVEEAVADYLLSFLPEDKRQKVELVNQPILFSKQSYLVCSKNYAKCFSYIEKFNRGLKKLKSTGEYDKILASFKVQNK